MKAAVGFLEPHMISLEGSSRGKVLLATVKGDVHDIGKNLVDIVLSNNGFSVVNLGIRVPSEQLIQAAREHQPDVIGLSGLLVKSAQQMVLTAGDLSEVGIDAPMVIGGAALSSRFAHGKVAPRYAGLCTYARDAMHGLELVERIVDPARREELAREVAAAVENAAVPARTEPAPCDQPRALVSSALRPCRLRLRPTPNATSRVFRSTRSGSRSIRRCSSASTSGCAVSVRRARETSDEKYAKLERVVDEVKREVAANGFDARVVWRFFPARAEGNALVLTDPDGGGGRRSVGSAAPSGSGWPVHHGLRWIGGGSRRAVRDHRRPGCARQGRGLEARR